MGKQKRNFQPSPKPHHSSAVATMLAIQSAIDQKGLDVRGLDIRNATDIADYFVIISGTSERHVQGLADKIALRMKQELGEEPNSMTGYEQAEWVLLDYGDLVVHIFYEPTRQHYRFDELWRKAAPLSLGEELEMQARKLRTGMVREPGRLH